MTDQEKKKKDGVFKQVLSEDELRGIAGGDWLEEINTCDSMMIRNIYGGNGFPNCASTMEEGSWCMLSDACATSAVIYWADSKHCYLSHD